MKTYNRQNLPPHFIKHSPTGFSWGYGGSGPADLARCLLIDSLKNLGIRQKEKDRLAEEWYQTFKWEVVSKWNNDWEITNIEVRQWLVKKVYNKIYKYER
jgi:hypothetical protein